MYPDNIVWADLRFNRRSPSNFHLIPSDWRVNKVETPDHVNDAAVSLLPMLLIFEFDRPDISSLMSLSHIRQRFATIPVLMLTEYHSEALAVWALRNRVADYLVLPVAQHQLVESVAEAITKGQSDGGNPIPNELRFRMATYHKTAPAVGYVESHYHEAVREESVAEICSLSVCGFSRMFKKEHAKTFREYLLSYRIHKACELLGNPGVNVTEVAFTVGFNDASYFSRAFKRVVGQTPTAFQQGIG
jgi:AraC-like DNA-binding protein/CheY-like chemotaxis protein